MSFQISPLPRSLFEDLFYLTAAQLAERLAVRTTVDKKPGFPCRVSLADAEIGEEIILANFLHQPIGSPYRSSHAVYVRPAAAQAVCRPDEIPEVLRSRTLSLRGFDTAGMMVFADLAEGEMLATAAETIFNNPSVSYIHAHFAKPGCYAARIDRI